MAAIDLVSRVSDIVVIHHCETILHDNAGMLGERGLGLVDHVPSGCVAKINIP
jgi:hypothetical protein